MPTRGSEWTSERNIFQNYYIHRIVIAAPRSYAWTMLLEAVRWGSEPPPQASANRRHSPTRGFSCVYLTSSIRTAETASVLAATAQIQVHPCTALDEAGARLQDTNSHTLLADTSIQSGNWQDALRLATRMPRRTALVLVSRLPDERLWLDALECGVYDLILEPLRADELRRVLTNAHFRAAQCGSSQFYVHTGAREPLVCAGPSRY
jgi:hypothetical protein